MASVTSKSEIFSKVQEALVDALGVDEDEVMYTFQDKDILECEFYVVEALQLDLILFHPFAPLLAYVTSYPRSRREDPMDKLLTYPMLCWPASWMSLISTMTVST